jgi:hypothetical protein
MRFELRNRILDGLEFVLHAKRLDLVTQPPECGDDIELRLPSVDLFLRQSLDGVRWDQTGVHQREDFERTTHSANQARRV